MTAQRVLFLVTVAFMAIGVVALLLDQALVAIPCLWLGATALFIALWAGAPRDHRDAWRDDDDH